jgi:hypothetical protein
MTVRLENSSAGIEGALASKAKSRASEREADRRGTGFAQQMLPAEAWSMVR